MHKSKRKAAGGNKGQNWNLNFKNTISFVARVYKLNAYHSLFDCLENKIYKRNKIRYWTDHYVPN